MRAKKTLPPARKPARRYHHGDLPRALLAEALRTIQEQGIEALTLRGVGQRLGVSRTALYRHFTDKDALLTAVGSEGFRLLRTALLKAWERGGRGRAGCDAMAVAYVRFALDHPAHYRVMFGGSFRPEDWKEQGVPEDADAFQVLVDSIIEQQRLGTMRAGDPRQLAQYIWSVVHGIAMLALDGIFTPAAAALELTRFATERMSTGLNA